MHRWEDIKNYKLIVKKRGLIMKAIIKSEDLKRLVKSTAKFISKDENRHMMTYIRLDFNKEGCSVKAGGIDGYKLSVESSKCVSVDENFVAYIKPYLPIGAKCKYANIEILGDNCLIDMDGRITGNKQPKGTSIDYYKILSDLEANPVKLKIMVNRFYLLDALKSMQQEDKSLNEPITLEFRDSIDPIIIKNKNGVKLIIPMRQRL